jgi:hypothetical protein
MVGIIFLSSFSVHPGGPVPATIFQGTVLNFPDTFTGHLELLTDFLKSQLSFFVDYRKMQVGDAAVLLIWNMNYIRRFR